MGIVGNFSVLIVPIDNFIVYKVDANFIEWLFTIYYKIHFVFLLLTSIPYMKVEPFLDSVKVSLRLGWFIICFLKFCKIREPFYFFYFESAIMASSSLRLLNWLTLSLKDISLSNYSPNCPVLIPVFNLLYFGRSQTLQSF